MKISIIAAMDSKRGIGKDNKLPWSIKEDMERFRSLTRGHPVIMGRKTFESIIGYRGKPLPDRINIVITHSVSLARSHLASVVITHSLLEAIEIAQKSPGADEIFIIGGGQIYKEALDKDYVNKLYLTIVEGDFGADTFFPDYSQFKKVVFEKEGESEGHKYKFLELER